MSRLIDEANQVIAKLESTFAVYNKSISEKAIVEWMEQLEKFGTDEIIEAFNDHTQGASMTDNGNQSKYAPKPYLIIELIKKNRSRKQALEKPQSDSQRGCDPVIAKAWHIFIWQIQFENDNKMNVGLIVDRHPEIKLSRSQVIEIVNREAAKHNCYDAIPDAYRIPGIISDPF